MRIVLGKLDVCERCLQCGSGRVRSKYDLLFTSLAHITVGVVVVK